MNRYQIREKSYTEALASSRVGGNLANSIIRTMPNMTSQFATIVNDTEVTKSGNNNFDLAYFQMKKKKKASRNLDYMREQVNMHYNNKKR